jgi:Apea-like HEPN
MRLKIDGALAQKLDERAEALIGRLAVEPEKPDDTLGTFRPNYLMSAVNLTGKEVPSAPVHPAVGIAGNEVARFFPDLNPPVGLFGSDHEELINICRALLESEALKEQVSMTFIVEAVFEWIRNRHQQTATQSMTEYVLDRCANAIAGLEVWIPIAGTEVEVEINMGKVVLKSVDQTIWQRWVSGWQARQPEGIEKIQTFLTEIGTERISVSAMKVTAEPIKAVELAVEESDNALNILRYFSLANLNPPLSVYTAISGKEYVERPRHMILRNGLLILAGRTERNLRSRHPWRIDSTLLSKMKERGFDTLVRLIAQKEAHLTDFQKSLLRAISIYSKSSLAQDLNDKLLYVIAALEYILLKDASESLQRHIGERMAFLIGKSLEARIEIIRNYKKAYALRSAAVHHGEVLKDAEALTHFMRDAWHTFNRLINEADRFTTKQNLIEFVDDLKFS